MRDIITIFKRELGAYLNSPMGAIFLIVFTLMASGLFVTEFFLFPVAELRSFFTILPFIFCVFIPALTMRLWAEERSENTVELLLTFPMHPMALVLGKYLAGLCFVLLALSTTLLLPIMITSLGNPDLGQLASSYLGAFLLGAFFLALGQLVSGFAQDQIVAFVLSLLACFILLLLGTNFAATALDTWINGLGNMLRQLMGVTEHYLVFVRGIVEIIDLIFFLIWIILFLFLNGLYIEGRGRKAFGTIFTVSTALCLGIGLTFNALISSTSLARFDWTAGQIHTVSDATKTILSELKVPVHLTYYVTPEEDMPTEIKTLERDIMDRLEELRLASSGLITCKRVHLRAANVLDSPLEPEVNTMDPLEKRMLAKGIEPFSVSAMRQTGSVSNLIYSSIGVAYKDKPEEIIPRIVPDSLSELEYALVSAVFRLTREKQPRIALAATEDFGLLHQVLVQEKYQVRPVSLQDQELLPVDTDIVLILNPMDLNERQLWDIREALAAGQKTILAVQSTQWDYNMAQGQITIHRLPVATGLEPLWKDLGISIEPKVLMDEQHTAVRVARSQVDQLFGTGMSLNLPMQIILTKEQMNADDPVTAHLDNIFYMWGSALRLDEKILNTNKLTATVLATSSPKSWLVDVPMTLTQNLTSPVQGEQKAYPVMVRLTGQFPANTKAAPSPALEDDPEATNDLEEMMVTREHQPGELILLGGAAMFNDSLLQNNIDLIMNTVDSMAYGSELIQIRGKKAPSRIILGLSPHSATVWKILTYCLPSLIIAALFGLRTWSRQRRRIIFSQTLGSKA